MTRKKVENDPTITEIISLCRKHGVVIVGTKKSTQFNSLTKISNEKPYKSWVLRAYSCDSLRKKANFLADIGIFTKRIRLLMGKNINRTGIPKNISIMCNEYRINKYYNKFIDRLLEGKITLDSLIEHAKNMKNKFFLMLKTNKIEDSLRGIFIMFKSWWYGLCYTVKYWANRIELCGLGYYRLTKYGYS